MSVETGAGKRMKLYKVDDELIWANSATEALEVWASWYVNTPRRCRVQEIILTPPHPRPCWAEKHAVTDVPGWL